MTPRHAVLVLAALCALPAFARADGNAEAKKHCNLALQLSLRNRHEDAIRELCIAWAASPQPDILFNLGRENAALGRREEAIDFFLRYLRAHKNAPDERSVLDLVEQLGGPEAVRRRNRVAPLRRFTDDTVVLDQVRYNEDKLIAAERVVVKAGAKIVVEGGRTLHVFARRLVIEGPATVDGRGRPGMQGIAGKAPPSWSTSERTEYEAACPPSARIDAGGPGGEGGPGGPGATIEFWYERLDGKAEDLTQRANVAGGPGGFGGRGGEGRNCIGPDPMRDRKNGPSGLTGRAGAPGRDGTFALRPLAP